MLWLPRPQRAGKSTTMAHDLLRLSIDLGTLNVLGMDVSEGPQREIKALIGVVPQEKTWTRTSRCTRTWTVYARYFQIEPKTGFEAGRRTDRVHAAEGRKA